MSFALTIFVCTIAAIVRASYDTKQPRRGGNIRAMMHAQAMIRNRFDVGDDIRV